MAKPSEIKRKKFYKGIASPIGRKTAFLHQLTKFTNRYNKSRRDKPVLHPVSNTMDGKKKKIQTSVVHASWGVPSGSTYRIKICHDFLGGGGGARVGGGPTWKLVPVDTGDFLSLSGMFS